MSHKIKIGMIKDLKMNKMRSRLEDLKMNLIERGIQVEAEKK